MTMKIVEHGYVYRLVAKDSGRVYIGSSGINPRLRMACHVYCSKKGKMPSLAEVFRAGTPEIEILEEHENISKLALREREQHFMDLYGELVVNKARAVFDQELWLKEAKCKVTCERCGKKVQKIYMSKHSKNPKCINKELNDILRDFGRLPCIRYRQKKEKISAPGVEVGV